MKRAGFIMKLKDGNVEEYKKRHDEIWPELVKELKDVGISDFTIYYDETTHTLFATQKLANENAAESLPEKAIVQKWWVYMADLMATEDDNTTPLATPMREVFHLD